MCIRDRFKRRPTHLTLQRFPGTIGLEGCFGVLSSDIIKDNNGGLIISVPYQKHLELVCEQKILKEKDSLKFMIQEEIHIRMKNGNGTVNVICLDL